MRRSVLFAIAAAAIAQVAMYAQIPGRSVNMVAGTTLPDGDPFLQRQNEGSLAVSSRNPCHLLGSNDYRTVDNQRDGYAEILVPRLVNDTHAAGAELTLDAIARAEGLADDERSRRDSLGAPRRRSRAGPRLDPHGPGVGRRREGSPGTTCGTRSRGEACQFRTWDKPWKAASLAIMRPKRRHPRLAEL